MPFNNKFVVELSSCTSFNGTCRKQLKYGGMNKAVLDEYNKANSFTETEDEDLPFDTDTNLEQSM